MHVVFLKRLLMGRCGRLKLQRYKGIQVKFFILNQNVVCLKFILTEFQVSTPFRFLDLYMFPGYQTAR